VIGSLRGTVLERTATGEAIVEVGGVGYRVLVAMRGLAAIVPGEPAFLFTHLHVREDALVLYGFPTRDERDTFEALIGANGVGPKLALAISWQESGWSQRQVSVANAIGAMQVIPSSGVWASELVGRKLNLLNAQDNVTAGMVILRSLTRTARSEQEAIASYYQGLISVQNSGMFPDTAQYVKSVLALKSRM